MPARSAHVHGKQRADRQQPHPLLVQRCGMQLPEGLEQHDGAERQEAEEHVRDAHEQREAEAVQRQRPLSGTGCGIVWQDESVREHDDDAVQGRGTGCGKIVKKR